MVTQYSGLDPKGEAMTCPFKASAVRQATDQWKFPEQCLSTEQCPYHHGLKAYISLQLRVAPQKAGEDTPSDTVMADLHEANRIPSTSCHVTTEWQSVERPVTE